jgi:hypothetical protein
VRQGRTHRRSRRPIGNELNAPAELECRHAREIHRPHLVAEDEPVAQLIDGVMTVISVSPVDSRLHEAAVQTYRNAGSSAVSFVDQTSFEFMRSNRLVEAFTFDSGYVSAGFELAS